MRADAERTGADNGRDPSNLWEGEATVHLERRSFLQFSLAAALLELSKGSFAAEGERGTPPAMPLPPGSELVPQLGHSGAVTAAAFSPDGRLIVSAREDGAALLWDAASGKELRRCCKGPRR